MTQKRKGLYIVGFICIFVLFFGILNYLLPTKRKPEITIDHYHKEYRGLYELDKDTVDVLIFGASHAFSSFSPEDLYEDYGITAYVQSSSCQRIWQSYYYLEEALKYQKPQYVILEPFWSFDATAQSEAYNREAIDPMRMSMTKIRAIHTAVSKNPEGEYGLSYIFPLLRYHDRWQELEQGDFEEFALPGNYSAKGFLPRLGIQPAQFNEEAYLGTEAVPMDESCLEYLDKMRMLCEENDIQFLIMSVPTCMLWNSGKAIFLTEYANEHGVTYLDYNYDEKLREQANIDWETDSLDGGNHLNYTGAMKMTNILGEYLTAHGNFEDKRLDSSYDNWQQDYVYYKQCVNNYQLQNAGDFKEFTGYLNDQYQLVATCSGIDPGGLNYDTNLALKEAGVPVNIFTEENRECNLLIIDGNGMLQTEYYDKINLELELSFLGQPLYVSENFDNALVAKLYYDAQTYDVGAGINLMVFDRETKTLVGNFCFVADSDGNLVKK